MKDVEKTREELLKELREMRQHVADKGQVEAELKESENRLRSIFRIAPVGIGLVIDRVIQDVNEYFCEMLDYDYEELIGKNALFVYPSQEEYDRVGRIKYTQIQEHGKGTVETQLKCKDGSLIDVFLNSTPLDPDNLSAGVIFTSLNITERLRAERELAESEEKFRILYNNSPDMYISVSPEDGRILLCNDTLLNKTGYQREEIIGSHINTMYHPDCEDEVKEIFQQFVTLGEVHDKELLLKKKDGSIIDVSLDVNSVRDEKGRILYSISCWRDITVRKRAEKELREKEEKYKGLFDTMSSGVAVYDAVGDGEDFIIVDTNPAFEEIERVRKEDVIGKRVSRVFPGVKDFGLFEVFQRVFRTGESEFFPQALYRDEKDAGSWRENWVYKLPSGEIVAVYNDVTERKHAEEIITKNQYYLTRAQEIGKIGTWEMDIQNDILTWTPETYNIFGVPPGTEMNIGLFLDCVHPDDKEFVLENWNAVFNHEPYDIEHRIIVKDEVKWIREKAEFELDSEGNVVLVIGFAQDITDYKKSEQALTTATNIINNSPAVVFSWKYEEGWPVEYVSENVEQLFGYSVKEFLGRTIKYSDLVHRDDLDRVLKEVDGGRNNKEQEIILHEPYRIIAKNGAVKWIRDKTSIRRDHRGVITHFEGIVFDISKQVISEQALKRSEKKYRELVDLAQEGIWVIDKYSITTFVNPRMARMLGYRFDEMVGKHLFSFMDERGVEIATLNLERRQQGISEQHDFEFIHKDNSRIIVTMETASITDKDGDYAGAIAGVIDITQRVQAERALKESQRQLSTLMSNLPGMAYRCLNDQNYTMKFVSSGCLPLTGYSPSDLVENAKVAYADIIHPDDQTPVWNTIQDALENNHSFQIIYRIKTLEGDEKWVWEQGQSGNTDKAGVTELEGFITDITDRIQAEWALSHSHELMKYIIEHNRSAVAVHDRDLKYIYVSKRYLTDYKVKYKDVIGKHHYDVFPDLPQKWREVHQRVLKGEILSADDDPYPREDGTIDWTRWECRPWYEHDGSIGGIIIYTEIITERKRIEQELKDNEQNFRDLVGNLLDGVAIADNNGYHLFVNQNFSKITGYSESELLKMTGWDLSRPEDLANLESKMKNRMEGTPVDAVYERIIVRKDGTEIPVEMSTTTTIWHGEKRPLAIIHDISERKQAERDKDNLLHQVQEANERLKSLSRDLINSQEDERKRISQELHDELGQALTAISLDLGIIEHNLHPETPPEIRERLADTKKKADDLDQMIGELALDLRPSLLDDLGLLSTLNWYVERFSERTEIEVDVEVSGEEKRLPDEIETALYRIIQEALTNVVKHAKAKKVDLQIDIRAGVVIVIIKDDGRGFDIDTLQFSEISPRGLGLIGMADRTALVGGEFKIYSKPEEGTRIEIEIPV